jgi:hypothetical protein
MEDQPAFPMITRSIERFRTDLQKRYAEEPGGSRLRIANLTDADEKVSGAQVRLQKLPPEIGVLLIVVGTAGILLPGPVGSPFLVAGGIALWPSGFRRVERWFKKVAPGMYETGIRQIEQFLSDLERRYPGSVR